MAYATDCSPGQGGLGKPPARWAGGFVYFDVQWHSRNMYRNKIKQGDHYDT